MPEKSLNIRTVFMGTSLFAKEILESLVKNNYNIISAYTQPDKPLGRKKELNASEVKRFCEEKNIPLKQPANFTEKEIDELRNLHPDIILVAAYGKILPQKILSLPKFGAVNVHPSLLPELRGPSPIQCAILQGKTETGITIMLMDAGMDSGDILAQEKMPISLSDTSESLLQKASEQSSGLLLKTLPLWIANEIIPKKQDASKATFCKIINKEDGKINWHTDSAENIFNKFRAFYPWPGIFCFWNNTRLKLAQISVQKNSFKENPELTSGTVSKINGNIGVKAAEGIIILEKIQPEGKKEMKINAFANGYPQFIGSVLK
jgi:methionyl-tRNA formyltransferase